MSESSSPGSGDAMSLPPQTLAKTRCRRNLACLSAEGIDLCQVEWRIEPDILFVVPKDTDYCPHRIGFGYSTICTCPVRIALVGRNGR